MSGRTLSDVIYHHDSLMRIQGVPNEDAQLIVSKLGGEKASVIGAMNQAGLAEYLQTTCGDALTGNPHSIARRILNLTDQEPRTYTTNNHAVTVVGGAAPTIVGDGVQVHMGFPRR